MFRKGFATFTYSLLLMALPAFAQEEDYTRFRSEASVQAIGSFVKSTTQSGVTQSADNTAGVLGSYRFYFNRHNGVEVDYGFTQNTERYGQSGIETNSHDVSAAYVFRLPMKHWSPFVLGGAGAMIFDPRNLAGANYQARAAFVYGGGADFNLSEHLFIRGQYRGFVYNSPTYDLASLSGFDRVTHRAEPSAGIGWRF